MKVNAERAAVRVSVGVRRVLAGGVIADGQTLALDLDAVSTDLELFFAADSDEEIVERNTPLPAGPIPSGEVSGRTWTSKFLHVPNRFRARSEPQHSRWRRSSPCAIIGVICSAEITTITPDVRRGTTHDCHDKFHHKFHRLHPVARHQRPK